MLYRHREQNNNGVSYGGVAVIWRESLCCFKKIEIKNPDGFEVLPCVGAIQGHSRKLVVIAC